jgi:hypothetical protein
MSDDISDDISYALKAKSDQLNAEDLLEPIVVTVTGVELKRSKEQPVWVHYEGGEGRPFKPCKSMLRVLARVWGKNSGAWAGKSMRLFRDEGVKYGGVNVGGIRISHMSHVDIEVGIMLTASKEVRKLYHVKPLVFDELSERAARFLATIESLEPTQQKLSSIRKKVAPLLEELAKAKRDDLRAALENTIELLASNIQPESTNV